MEHPVRDKNEPSISEKFTLPPSMLAFARQRILLDYLNEKGSVRTAEVAKFLNVTEETVRRDFEKLEKEGSLLRAHGGAICLDVQKREIPVKDRSTQNAPGKKLIAQAAVKKIEPGHTIFLDPSTTVQQLARLITDQPITVVTNSLQIPDFFANKPAIQVIVLGGYFRASSRSCIGYPAELSSDLFRIDSAFISCRGIDTHGLSEATEEQARLKRYLLKRVSNLYLLADSSKVNISSSHYFAESSDVDVWFTDKLPDIAFERQMKHLGIRIEASESAS